MAQKIGATSLKFWTLLSNVQTLKKIASNFCGLLRKPELYLKIEEISRENAGA